MQISLDESLFQYKAPVSGPTHPNNGSKDSITNNVTQTGGKPVGYIPEAGQRKPSSLPVAKRQALSAGQVKTEPDQKDVQFAELLKRLVPTNGDPTPAEDHKDQPLGNNQTLAVAMQVDSPVGIVKRETVDAKMPIETVKHESDGQEDVNMKESLEQEDATPQDLRPEDMEQDDVKQEQKPTVPLSAATQEVPQSEHLDDKMKKTDTSAHDTDPPGQTSPYFISAADTYVTMPLMHM